MAIKDTNNNELVSFSATASAVNEITVKNAATANAPEISASGTDTNIDLKLTPKGSGNLILDGLEFPNADGSASQVLQTNGSGVLSFATPSGGKVLQVVSSSKTDTTTVSHTTSFTDTGLSATITPTAATSKILVTGFVNGSTTSTSIRGYFVLTRADTAILEGASPGSRVPCTNMSGSNGTDIRGVPFNFLDSPSTTSATTYKIRVRNGPSDIGNTGINLGLSESNTANYGRGACTMTLIEIDGA
jgi:hypothetical protein